MKVKFLTPVQHDAANYAVGDTADVPNPAAKLLISTGAAEPFDPAAAKLAEVTAAAALAEAGTASGKLV